MTVAAAGSSVAGIINAIGTWFTGIAAVIIALSVLIPILRRSKRTEDAIEEVHVLVNQQHADSMARMAQLEAALRAGGLAVPTDPSLTGPTTQLPFYRRGDDG